VRIEAARAAPQAKVARMLTGVAERYGAMVENLEHVALRD
jgi:hypothetical protein